MTGGRRGKKKKPTFSVHFLLRKLQKAVTDGERGGKNESENVL